VIFNEEMVGEREMRSGYCGGLKRTVTQQIRNQKLVVLSRSSGHTEHGYDVQFSLPQMAD